ncbi:MAG: hypothetical protein R3F22_09370 [Lysobacteraceae bacterium]
MNFELQALISSVLGTLFVITGAAMLLMPVGEREQERLSKAARWSPLAGALRDGRLRRVLGVAAVVFGAVVLWVNFA